MEAQAVVRVRPCELVGPGRDHGAVDERSDERACSDRNERERQGVCGSRSGDRCDGTDRTVEEDEPHRVAVSRAERRAKRGSGGQPFTPADATPATKYRWKTRYTMTIGAIAITLAAMRRGHSVWYWNTNCAMPICTV